MKISKSIQIIIIIIIILIFKALFGNELAKLNCQLPEGLEFRKVHIMSDVRSTQFVSNEDSNGFLLNVPSDRPYKFDLNTWLDTGQFKLCNRSIINNYLHIQFPKRFVLNKDFNLQDLFEFLLRFWDSFSVYLINLRTVELDLGIIQYFKYFTEFLEDSEDYELFFYNVRFDFRVNNSVKTCQELIDSKVIVINSIFQIFPRNKFIEMLWLNPVFVRPLCPAVFWRTRWSFLIMTGVINSFYKRNVLEFTNHSIDYLDSTILNVEFFRCENLELDTKLFNPSVFAKLEGTILCVLF